MAGPLKLVIAGKLPEGADAAPAQLAVDALCEVIEELPAGRVNLKLVDDDHIRALNREYAGQDAPTDVLSFSYIPEGGEELGDIAVCWPIAIRQAAAAGITPAEELALLTVHGVLHILGHDHQSAADQAQLEALQEEILGRAGITHRKFNWTS